MKYVRPIYESEAIETIDIINASGVKVGTIQKEIEVRNENGEIEKKIVDATQVSIDFYSLFR